MMYGTRLRFLGEFFKKEKVEVDSTTFVSKLRDTIEEIRPTQIGRHGQRKVFINKDLMKAGFVLFAEGIKNLAVSLPIFLHSVGQKRKIFYLGE